MLTITQIAGFAGAGLSGAAYVPQISHLIRARCSAGLSRLAFGAWLLASVLVTARAIAIDAGVFIVLGGIQIAATRSSWSVLSGTKTRLAQAICLTSPRPRRPRSGTSGNEPPVPGVRPIGRRPPQLHPPGTSGHRERPSPSGTRDPMRPLNFT